MKFNDIDSPKKLLDFMNQNIKYGFVGRNRKLYFNLQSENSNDWYNECLVQTGEEVLKSKVGTCWDQVELERLWFEKRNYDIKTIFIWFEVDYENNYPTHTFLLYKEDSKWYWFEHAFEDYRGIHKFSSVEKAIKYVISKHLEYAINEGTAKPDDKKLIVSYEYTKLNNSTNVDGFINHVTENPAIYY